MDLYCTLVSLIEPAFAIFTLLESKDILRGEGFETWRGFPLKAANRSTSLCCRVKLHYTATQHVLGLRVLK